MKPLTEEWLKKAEDHYRSMRVNSQADDHDAPNFDAACLHAYLCVENVLKAFLQENVIYFPKCHDIVELFKLTLSVHPEWQINVDRYAFLTQYDYLTRDPLLSASKNEAEESIRACEDVRTMMYKAISTPETLRAA